ncbi:MAG: hypothetical protein JO316_10925 [Abitibacteriaceae bacterium]|nr:hypothetical protein [Abditibacteriaceae bacterium]
MNKVYKSFVALGIFVGVTITKPALAQSTGPVPVRVKLGVLLPAQSTTKNFAGSTQFNAEADVAIPSLGAGRTLVGLGYSQGSKNGGKLRSIPLTVTRLFSPPNPVAGVTGNVYFGLGAGAYFLRASGPGGSASKTRPGAFGVVGYQFPNPFFVEAKYHIVGKVVGVSPTGLSLMIGRRF